MFDQCMAISPVLIKKSQFLYAQWNNESHFYELMAD